MRIVGEEEGAALNLQYRGKDYATNVLTFDYEREPVVMADLVLCGPVVEREAREQRKPLQDHYAHLLVHGTLHAQGYDHETGEDDALRMEALEILLLGSLGSTTRIELSSGLDRIHASNGAAPHGLRVKPAMTVSRHRAAESSQARR